MHLSNVTSPTPVEKDKMFYDVVTVGCGPAGLSTAIRLKQLSKDADMDLSICVVDKGSEIGSHILSGLKTKCV